MAGDALNHTNRSSRTSFREKRPSIYELRNGSLGISTSSRSMRNLFASFDNDSREDQLKRSERSARSDGMGGHRSYFDRPVQASALSASGRRPLPRIPSMPGVDDDDEDENYNDSGVGESGGVGPPTEILPHNPGDVQVPRLVGFDNATEKEHVLGTEENAAGPSKSDDELDDYFVRENGN